MTTTTTDIPAVELTMEDRHRIAADLYAWNGFGDKILRVSINETYPVEVQVYAHGTDAGHTMQVARDMLDDPTVTARAFEDGEHSASSIHVQLTGTYLGIQFRITDVLADMADRDLIRDLPADRVIDALAGDASREG